MLVDITYDLTAPDSATLDVTIAVSDDNGSTWTVPCDHLTGSGVGGGVAPGTGKAIVWDAGLDWSRRWSDWVRVAVTANDEFVRVPAGTFTMGDPFGEGNSSELPLHSVSLAAFQAGRYEVPKALWDDVFAWAADHSYSFDNVGRGKVVDHPVNTVSWYDVVKWCNARSQRDGLTPCYTVDGALYRTGQRSDVLCDWAANGYRLPSEAEWEYAARGGVAGLRFPWGNTISHQQANYESDSACLYDVSATPGYHPEYGTGGYPYTSPVGAFTANGYGLFGTAGNAWEWCWDWHGNSYYSQSPSTDPHGPSSGSLRAFRGGCWSSGAIDCRSSGRHGADSDRVSDSIGFRLAVTGHQPLAGTASGTSGAFTVDTGALAVDPNGGFLAAVNPQAVLAQQGIWDLTGTYTATVAGHPLIMSLAHDARGRITGTATYVVAEGKSATMPVRGAVKGADGAVALRCTMKGSEPFGTASASLKFVLAMDAPSRTLTGLVTGRRTVGKDSFSVADGVTMAIPPPMDGTWAVRFGLSQFGAAIGGTAKLTLANGTERLLAVKGKAAGTEATISLTGHPADAPAKAIKIKATITPLEGGWARIESLSGKAYGQTISW